MIRVIQQGLNPILNQYDYPELQVRIGYGNNIRAHYFAEYQIQ